jgi:hypothetical protein
MYPYYDLLVIAKSKYFFDITTFAGDYKIRVVQKFKKAEFSPLLICGVKMLHY